MDLQVEREVFWDEDYQEMSSDDSLEMEDLRHHRLKTEENSSRLNAGVDNFSAQFSDEKLSIEFKRKHYHPKMAQFLQEKKSGILVSKWLELNQENFVKMKEEREEKIKKGLY